MSLVARPSPDAERPDAYLASTYFLDHDHPAVRALAERAVGNAHGDVDRAVRLYYAVRDGFIYDPYSMELRPEAFRASSVIERGRGYCVTKAALLAAAARAAGIPARVGFADVRNHLATERLLRLMGTDLFYYHGYVELWLEGRWVKATPAFNIELCAKFRVLPLEFDGRTDSVFHPFDADNRRHMEYVLERGHRPDVPFDEIREAMLRYYPRLTQAADRPGGDFAAEAATENSQA